MAYTLDANVIAAFFWDDITNRGKNYLGNSAYDLTVNGTSHTFNTSTKKYLTAWNNGANNANGYFTMPAALKTALSGLSAFTIECWWKPPTQVSGSNQHDMFYWIEPSAWITYVALASVSNSDAANQLALATSGYSLGAWSYSTTDFVNVQICWSADTDTLRMYINGTLIVQRSITTNTFTAGNAIVIGKSPVASTSAVRGLFDAYIISDIDRAGTPTPITSISIPTITDISPITGSVSGGTAVTITGTEFATGATVTFDGNSATSIVVVSATEITCVTPAHTAGAVDVVITNTDTGTVTAVNGYTYVNPTITDITPLTGTTAGGTAVTITGTLFMAGAAVTFGGDAATSVVVVSDTSITCVTPAHAAGAVVVTNTDASTVTAVEGFTYIVPFIADTHFVSAIYPQDFTVFLTDTNITNFQKEPYERNEELNVIDTFDFAFDKVTASAPLEFFKFLNNRAQNTLKIKNKSGNTIYIGKVSGVKSGMEINFANKSLFIESYPLIEDISTDFAIYNIAATNPIKIIKQLLDASVDASYTVSKIHGLATVLSGISISVDTDGEEENTKSIIQSICEAFNVGVYLEDLTVRAYAVQILPNDATDITPYLVNLRPKFTSRGDLYADKIMLTYTPTLGGTEATITAGTGDTAKEITISAPIFIDATSAGLAAERARAIYSQELYEAELEADKTAMFKLGDTVKYPSELGNFICLIIGKNTTRNQITYKVLGVLK